MTGGDEKSIKRTLSMAIAVQAVTNQGGPVAAKACDEAAGALIKIHAEGPGR